MKRKLTVRWTYSKMHSSRFEGGSGLMPLDSVIQSIAKQEIESARDFLLDLLRFPSLSGDEGEAMEFLEREFTPLVDRVDRVGFPSGFQDDPEYSFPVNGLDYSSRHNLRCVWNENATGPTVIVNAHVDVVPPSKGQISPFNPRLEEGTVYARGACDDKGQIACLLLLMRILNRLPEHPNLRLHLHLVVEEENGGNGTLGMIRAGDLADAAIVMEPTAGAIITSVRGAVWFRVTTSGTAGHSGQSDRGVSALELVLEAKSLIENYHKRLLEESGGIPLFEAFPNPMPITFGKLHCGEWPAMVPDLAILEGVMGFLPNRTREQVIGEICSQLQTMGSEALSKRVAIEFMYRHDCHVINPHEPMVSDLALAIRLSGISPVIAAFPASCDSWYYNNLLGIPTVVFGVGDLAHAHTSEEQIRLDEIERISAQLAHFVHLFSARAMGGPLHADS
jgi:acetylornithine deacetylase